MSEIGRRARTPKRPLRALLALVLAGAVMAAPASAEGARFKGKTKQGQKITFIVEGKKISKVRTLVWSFCGQTGGSYDSKLGYELFHPPGKFRVGKQGSKTATRPSAMWGGEKKEFHYKFLGKLPTKRRAKGKLSYWYSFSEYDWWSNSIYFWNCSGSTTFTARRR